MARLAATIVAMAAVSVIATTWRREDGRHAGPGAPTWRDVPATAGRLVFEHQLDDVIVAVDTLGAATRAGRGADAARAFRRARTSWKHAEGLVEYFAPETAERLNGPSPEVEGDAPQPPLGAGGAFQRIEGSLAEGVGRHPGAAGGGALEHGVTEARGVLVTLRAQTRLLSISRADILDAARLEIARVSTLGLAGFDTQDSTAAVLECADALDGTRAALADDSSGVDGVLRDAAAYLRTSAASGTLDRLTFIVQFANPAARAVARARERTGVPRAALRRAWRTDVAGVFDGAAFDASAYAPEIAPAATAELVGTGRRLFYDPRLSGPGTRSCATCHDPSRAFTDGRSRSATFGGATARNTPTLLNAAFEPLLFADQRAGSLEEQVARVLASPAEMASSAELAAQRVGGMTATGVRTALAAYVRSLAALDSRFDRAARGDDAALSAVERRGFNVFMGKARCGTCHFAPLFSGTMPPGFVRSELEIIGVPARAATHAATLDPDPGRAGVDQAREHRFAFKVPSLRNVALTAPYFHNGAYATLEEVIEFYDLGGGSGIGASVPSQTLPARALHLSRPERDALAAFLRALTDSVSAREPSAVLRSR